MSTYKITKKGIKKRMTPSTTLKKAEIKKQAEALKSRTPEEQAKILEKIATKKEFIPRGRPVWAVPPPHLPVVPNLPANQPYTQSKFNKFVEFSGRQLGRKVAEAVLPASVEGYFSPWSGELFGYLGAKGERMAQEYFGYGVEPHGYSTLLHPNHPAHYRLDTTNEKGTPFNPIYRSMAMVNAY